MNSLVLTSISKLLEPGSTTNKDWLLKGNSFKKVRFLEADISSGKKRSV